MDIKKNGYIADAGVTYPLGFKAGSACAGLKQSGALDMAIIFSETPAVAAGAFTSSLFPAAPVLFDKKAIEAKTKFSAVVVNSGNANACTGDKGMQDAVETASQTAMALGVSVEEVLVASTGRIGVPLPMDIIARGIKLAAESLSSDGGAAAAEAIMTTDTCPKRRELSISIGGEEVRLGGMVKGAGMIDPEMTVPHATMLAFITTDAAVDPAFLSLCLSTSVNDSFNKITIDGDMSTNDTVLVLANGKAGNAMLSDDHPDAAIFAEALTQISRELAMDIVLDAEGATKFVTVRVSRAGSENDAKLCAEAISNSMLCKTAWFGGDPNWGRVLAAAGYSGAKFAPENVSLSYDETPVVSHGEDAGTTEADLEKILANDSFSVSIDLGAGSHSYEMWTNDISYEYVKINADYHT